MNTKTLIILSGVFLVACGSTPTTAPNSSPDTKPSSVKPVSQPGQLSFMEFAKEAEFKSIKISPDGQHFAALTPVEGKDALAIIRRKDMQISASYRFNELGILPNFTWVNNERVVFETFEQVGYLDRKFRTCNLYGVNVDDSKKGILFGPGARDASREESRMGKKDPDRECPRIINIFPEDDRRIIIEAEPIFNSGTTPTFYTLDVYSGNKRALGSGPVGDITYPSVLADSNGNPRFAFAETKDFKKRFYVRPEGQMNWQLQEETDGSYTVFPLHLTADNKKLYLSSNRDNDRDRIFIYDLDSKQQELVFADESVDVNAIFYDGFTQKPLAIAYSPGKPQMHYLDKDYERLHKTLRQAFPDQWVRITSRTQDGTEYIVLVSSDKNSGEFFIYNTQAKSVTFLFARQEWLDPNLMASMQPIQLAARDGVTLNGYLTVPKDSSAKNLPLIVYPHGGPHGVRDFWGFNPDVQVLANRGYAVLQINFRGSGGYGKRFETSGHGEWGAKMQDDVTDATRWAIDQGIADANRICIYGNSYGAYSAMMGVIKEQGLYQCAAGYVGVYDLPLLYSRRGDIARDEFGVNYLKAVLGEDEAQLKARSPVYNADKIKVPVFLIHGGEDDRTPIAHAKRLRDALEQYQVPYEWMVKDSEAHGFANPENRAELYQRLIAFFDKHIGQ